MLKSGFGAEICAMQSGPWWRVERRDGVATLRARRPAGPEALPDRQWLATAATGRAPGEFAPVEVEALFVAFLEGSAWPDGIAWEPA